MKQLNSKQALAACQKLHAQIVKHLQPECEGKDILPGDCTPQLQCAHIVPKKAARWAAWYLQNGWTLCAYHHRMIDHNQALWYRLAKTTDVLYVAEELQKIHEEGNLYENRVTFLRTWVQLLLMEAKDLDISPNVPNYVQEWAEAQ